MRIIVTMAMLCLGTALVKAAPADIVVSPDGRYIVCFTHGKREVLVPTWDGDKFAGNKTQTWDVASLVLLDRRSGETTGLVDYDPQGGPLPTKVSEFKAVWSPDGRYIAVSYPENAKTEHFFDGKGRVFVTINRHPDAEVAIFRVRHGRRQFVDLPASETYATPQRSNAQGGQVVARWEGARTLWSVDGRNGKLYRYRLR
jgi:hypothetical protein